jgi:hypothetical protein
MVYPYHQVELFDGFIIDTELVKHSLNILSIEIRILLILTKVEELLIDFLQFGLINWPLL